MSFDLGEGTYPQEIRSIGTTLSITPGNSFLVVNGTLAPGDTNVHHLGTSTSLWQTVWATNGDFSTQVDAGNLRLQGNTLSSTDTNGNVVFDANGTGNVVVSDLFRPSVNNSIDSGSTSFRWANMYTVNLNASGTSTLASVDIDGGTIDGTTIGGTVAAVGTFTQVNVDNLRLDGNTLSSTDTNGNIIFNANGTGNVVFSDTARPNADDTTDLGSASNRWMDGFFSSSVRIGDTLTVTSSDRILISGETNTMSSSNNGFVSGLSNTLSSCTEGAIVGGVSTVVSGGFRSVAVGGNALRVIGCNHSVAVGGNGNGLTNSANNSSIVAGQSNAINTASRAAIIAGFQNSLTGACTHSVLIGGQDGTIASALNAVVLKGGSTSRTYSTGNQIYLDSTTISTYGNVVPNADNTLMVGTNDLRFNQLHLGDGFEVSDGNNTVDANCSEFGIVGSFDSVLNGSQWVLMTGAGNTMDNALSSVIVGDNSVMEDTLLSAIIGCTTSRITGPANCCIVGGNNNRITGSAERQVIIGGQNLTLTASTANTTVIKGNNTARTITAVGIHLDGVCTCYGNVTPQTTNTFTMGSSSLRWSTVFGVNFNASGTATLTSVDIDGGTIDNTTIGGTTPAVGTFTQVNVDNLRLDGNTISSTDTNGNIIFDANGTGNIVCSDVIRPNTDDSTELGTSTQRWSNIHASASIRVGDTFTIGSGMDRYGLIGISHSIANSNTNSLMVGNACVLNGVGNNMTVGNGNRIVGSGQAVCVGGTSNSITNTATNAGIFAGSGHILNGSLRACMLSGANNSITGGSTDSVIIGGANGTISGSNRIIVLKTNGTTRTYTTSEVHLDGPSQCYGNVYPNATNTYSSGTSSLRWSTVYGVNFDASGTATLATVDINGGAIDGTTIGGTTPAAGTFTQVNVDNIQLNGNTISITDTNGNLGLTANGTGNIVCSNTTRPSTDATTDLGTSSARWMDGYFSTSVRVGNINSVTGSRCLAVGDGITVAGNDSCVVGGTGNQVSAGQQSIVCGGLTNAINSTRAFIGGGQLNTITNTSTQAAILGGFSNTINGSLRSAVVAGNANSITSGSNHSVIVGGTSSTISGATAAIVIKGGTTTRTYSNSNRIYLDSSTIECYGNVVPDTDIANDLGTNTLRWRNLRTRNALIGGQNNSNTGNRNCIVGEGCSITNTASNSIIVGKNCTMDTTLGANALMACEASRIITNTTHTGNSAIIGGVNGTIDGSTNCVLINCSSAATSTTLNTSNRFFVNCANHARFNCHIRPELDNTYDLGSASLQWANIYSATAVVVSDARLKEDVEPLNTGLETVVQFQPVSFNWKSANMNTLDKKQYGFIAQEVEAVEPGLVRKATDYAFDPDNITGDTLEDKQKEREDDYRSLNYNAFIPLLVNSIKELKQLVDSQQTEITTLKQQVQELQDWKTATESG